MGTGAWIIPKTPLDDATYKITATTKDPAGNTSPVSKEFVLTVDTKADAPVITGIEEDSGSSAIDGSTNDNTLTIKGTAEANATVSVMLDGTLIGTAKTDSDGNWSLDHTQTPLDDATYKITATTKDPAGNTSPVSKEFVLTVDTTSPVAPVITGIDGDSGSLVSGGSTNDTTLTIKGTAEARSTVSVMQDGVVIGTAESGSDGNWSLDHTQTPLDDATYKITATTKDPAGNTSPVSKEFVLTVDTKADAPVITGIEEDSGSSAIDGSTNDNTLTIKGTAEANATVSVMLDGTLIGTAKTDSDGNWSLDHTQTPLDDATYKITATTKDPRRQHISCFKRICANRRYNITSCTCYHRH